MLISRTWLLELLGHPLDLDDEALGEALTSLGLEVDTITHHGELLGSLIIGRVDGVSPHPKADRLRLVRLFDGNLVQPVVCGAPNVPAPGGLVVFAPVGAKLPGGLEIAARKIRGEESRGMICSETELEIGIDGDGIIVINEAWTPGDRLSDRVPGLIDTVYELGITPNRPDALGHIGVARDLAARLELSWSMPHRALPDVPVDSNLVALRAPKRCGRYIGHAFEDAVVGPSPLWLRVRLHRLGLRPINNVVDITNLILMKWGQPLHAFDRQRLSEGRVVVRQAAPDESMVALDERELKLVDDDLVIADANAPQALAGVMGGANSGVEAGASRLLLEAAWFAPAPIRQTAKRHGFSTDSSYRFERGVDHGEGLTQAAADAAHLLITLAGAQPVAACETTGQRPEQAKIPLRLERIEVVLGVEIPSTQARRILRAIGVAIDDADPNRWICTAPTHRPDLQQEVDLIEELIRHHGLEHLPARPSLPTAAATLELSEVQAEAVARARLEQQVVDALVGAGFHEHVSFSFTRRSSIDKVIGDIDPSRAVELRNPLNTQTGWLRTHLLPGLLDALALNAARHSRPVRLFEFGRVYGWPTQEVVAQGPTADVDRQLPGEHRRAGIVVGASAHDSDSEVRSLAGSLLDIFERVGVDIALRSAQDDLAPYLHPGVQAVLSRLVDGTWETLGRVGEVHPDLVRQWDLPDQQRPVFAELEFERLVSSKPAAFRALPRFPSTSRDLSLEVPVDLAAVHLTDALWAAEQALGGNEDDPRLAIGDGGGSAIEVLEDYRGEGLAPHRRAVLLRLHYRATGRSVTDQEVQQRHQSLVEQACAVLTKLDPEIRAR